MALDAWSTTANNNNAAAPNGAPEGMSPSSVNNTIRQVMADIRLAVEGFPWVDWGHVPTYVSGTSFTVPTDLTAIYQANRRLKLSGPTMGTIYKTISSSSYSDPDTTVTLSTSGLLSDVDTISISIIEATNDSVPANVAILDSASDFTTAPTISSNAIWHAGNQGVAASGFHNGLETHVVDDGLISGSFFDIDLNIASTTFETVGPTGSGATNIWASLDVVPTTAKALIFRVTNTSQSSGAGAVVSSVHMSKGSASPGINNDSIVNSVDFTAAGSGEYGSSVSPFVVVAVDSDLIIKIGWNASGGTYESGARLIGYLK